MVLFLGPRGRQGGDGVEDAAGDGVVAFGVARAWVVRGGLQGRAVGDAKAEERVREGLVAAESFVGAEDAGGNDGDLEFGGEHADAAARGLEFAVGSSRAFGEDEDAVAV